MTLIMNGGQSNNSKDYIVKILWRRSETRENCRDNFQTVLSNRVSM